MPKKFYFLLSAIFFVFALFLARVYHLSYTKHNFYVHEYQKISEVYVEGLSAPRGRILDINGKILVDNEGINTIIYHKPSNATLNQELSLALSLARLTNCTYNYNEAKLKDYYLLLYPKKASSLLTDVELKLYSERKLTKNDLTNIKKSRLTTDMLEKLTKEEKHSSYFYYLMNDGYAYENKILLKDLSDTLYANIIEANLPGIVGEISWRRTYPYGQTLKSILGTLSSSLPKEKENLLKKGYSLKDQIGISGLEEYYEDVLKGTKARYKVKDNNLILVSPSKKGDDITLEIDIDLQLKVESIIKNQITAAKKMVNTKYYKESYALISEPKTGAMKVIAGLRLLPNGDFQDVSINVIKNAYTVGSAVKAASMAVGYQYHAIDIGTTMKDSCVKLKNLPAKCSYRSLGYLNDIDALALSSNYYQFLTALKVAGYKYTYNMKAPVTIHDFNKYREVFASFGLGTTTGIDLPSESSGLKGSIVSPDLFLNLAIGQYDLYTPTSLIQYINTIANNGIRLKLRLLNHVKDTLPSPLTPLNTLNLEAKYLNRIQNGLKAVIKSGTGYWYVNQNISAAGKTGTSESYIDSDYDGKLDAYVLSNTFLMYAPFDDPKYSLVVISPNTSDLNSKSKYRAPINRLIARNINDFLFSSS